MLSAPKALTLAMKSSPINRKSTLEDIKKELLTAIKKNAKLGSTSLTSQIKVKSENPRKALEELCEVFTEQGYKLTWALSSGEALIHIYWDYSSISRSGYKKKELHKLMHQKERD